MEVFFTSPILGQIYGKVTAQSNGSYRFIGKSILVSIDLRRLESGWICEKEEWLHDSQVQELGEQIDKEEEWISAR